MISVYQRPGTGVSVIDRTPEHSVRKGLTDYSIFLRLSRKHPGSAAAEICGALRREASECGDMEGVSMWRRWRIFVIMSESEENEKRDRGNVPIPRRSGCERRKV